MPQQTFDLQPLDDNQAPQFDLQPLDEPKIPAASPGFLQGVMDYGTSLYNQVNETGRTSAQQLREGNYPGAFHTITAPLTGTISQVHQRLLGGNMSMPPEEARSEGFNQLAGVAGLPGPEMQQAWQARNYPRLAGQLTSGLALGALTHGMSSGKLPRMNLDALRPGGRPEVLPVGSPEIGTPVGFGTRMLPPSSGRVSHPFVGGQAGMAEPHAYPFDLLQNPDVLSGTVPDWQRGAITQVEPTLAANYGQGNATQQAILEYQNRANEIIKKTPEELAQPQQPKVPESQAIAQAQQQQPQTGDYSPKAMAARGVTPAEPAQDNPIIDSHGAANQYHGRTYDMSFTGGDRQFAARSAKGRAMKAWAAKQAAKVDASVTPESHVEATPPGDVPQSHAEATHPTNEGTVPQTHEEATTQELPAQSDNKSIQSQIDEQHYPSTGLQRGMNDTSRAPVIKGGIRQPQQEYPGYKGEISNEASVASEATPEDIAAAQQQGASFGDTIHKLIKSEEGSFGTDFFHKILTGNKPTDGGVGDVSVGESVPQKSTDLLTKLANLRAKTTRTVLGTHVPFTAISFHGFNVAMRHTLFGETFNPLGSAQRALEAINYLVRPGQANEYMKANPSEVAEARIAGVTNNNRDIGQSLFKGNNILTKGFNYLTDPKPLFGQVIPALKTKAYIKIFDNMHDSGMPMPEARAKAAEAVNNIYGGLNMRMLERNTITQKVFRAAALAPDWLETNVRLGKGMGQSILNPTNPAYKAYRVGVSNFLGSYVVMNIINAVNNDGKFMFQNDPGHELDTAIGQDDDGRVRYWRPFGTAMDMIRIPLEIAHSAIEGDTKVFSDVFRSRVSEPGQFVTDIMSNTNWKGDPIWGRNKFGQQMSLGHQMYNFADDAMSHFAPAPVSAGVNYLLGKNSGEETTAKMLQLPLAYKKPEKPPKKMEKKWKY